MQSNSQSKNILVVAAHPDDEVLGCGATIVKHIADGDKVVICLMGYGRDEQKGIKIAMDVADKLKVYDRVMYNYPDNQFDTVPLLKIVKNIEYVIKAHDPGIIYTHHYGDVNIDHKLTYQAVQSAVRPMKGCSVKKMLSFEIPSSTEWNFAHNNFRPNYFIDTTNYINKSLEALKCYESELRPFPHPRSEEYIRSLARVRGGQSGYDYAQAFEVIYER